MFRPRQSDEAATYSLKRPLVSKLHALNTRRARTYPSFPPMVAFEGQTPVGRADFVRLGEVQSACVCVFVCVWWWWGGYTTLQSSACMPNALSRTCGSAGRWQAICSAFGSYRNSAHLPLTRWVVLKPSVSLRHFSPIVNSLICVYKCLVKADTKICFKIRTNSIIKI